MKRLHGLRPDLAVLKRECDVAIVKLLAHRDAEAQTERADEILVLVSVEYETVDKLDLVGILEEIESHDKWQPLPSRGAAVHAFHLDGASDVSVLLKGHIADTAGVLLAAFGGDEVSAAGNLHVIDIHSLDKLVAAFRDDDADRAGVDLEVPSPVEHKLARTLGAAVSGRLGNLPAGSFCDLDQAGLVAS